MSSAQVNAIFESCPSKEDIPPHLVDRFKRECILDLRELWQSDSLPSALGTECFIPVKKVVSDRPIPCHNPEKLAALKDILQSMLDRDIIGHSCSPFNSPAFLVPKKDPKSSSANDKWRLVNDLSAVNANTEDRCTEPPTIESLISALAGSCWFSSTDLTQAFW